MTNNKEEPPSYKDSVSSYVPPPAYSERDVQNSNSNTHANTSTTRNQEDEEMNEMLSAVTDLTEFNHIDSFDFQQLDDVLNGVDLSSNVPG